MDFNWEDFLKVAELIKQKSFFVEDELEEAFIRTAISRAYYASFKKAVLYLERESKELTDENKSLNSHEYVIKSFRNKGNNLKKQNLSEISDNLSELKNIRKSSDYDFNFRGDKLTKLHVNKAIKLSKKIIEEINKL